MSRIPFRFQVGDRLYHRLYDDVIIDQKRIIHGRPYYRIDSGQIVSEASLIGN